MSDNDNTVSSPEEMRRERDQRVRQQAQARADRTADSARRITEANQVFQSHMEMMETRIQTRLDRLREEIQGTIDGEMTIINSTVQTLGTEIRELCNNTDASQNELYAVVTTHSTELGVIHDQLLTMHAISSDAHELAHQAFELNTNIHTTMEANQHVMDGFPEDLNSTLNNIQQEIQECQNGLTTVMSLAENGDSALNALPNTIQATVDSTEIDDLIAPRFNTLQTTQNRQADALASIGSDLRDGLQRTEEHVLGYLRNEHQKQNLLDTRIKAKVDDHDFKLNRILEDIKKMRESQPADIGSPIIANAIDSAMGHFTSELSELLRPLTDLVNQAAAEEAAQMDHQTQDEATHTNHDGDATDTSSSYHPTSILSRDDRPSFTPGTPRLTLQERLNLQVNVTAMRASAKQQSADNQSGFSTPGQDPNDPGGGDDDDDDDDAPSHSNRSTDQHSTASSVTRLDTPSPQHQGNAVPQSKLKPSQVSFPSTMSPIAQKVHQQHGVHPTAPGTSYTPIAVSAQTLGSKSRVTAQSAHLQTHAPPIDWLEISRAGPYAGSHDKVIKSFPSPPEKDDPDLYMQFYLTLRGHLQSNGFHTDLIPCIHNMKHDVDLRLCPIDPGFMVSIPGAHLSNSHNVDYSQWGCPLFWQNQHRRLGSTLYQGFVDRAGKCKERIPQFWNCVNRGLNDASGCGWTILNALLLQFHSGIAHTMAPEYTDLIPLRPSMKSPSDRYDDYIEKYKNWLRRIKTCEKMFRTDSEWDYSIWFLEGLHQKLREPFIRELRDMKLCARSARRQDLAVPAEYSIDSFADILIELYKLPARVQLATGSSAISHSAVITTNASAGIGSTTPLDLSETSMWISSLAEEETNGNDTHLIIAGVSAIHGPRRHKGTRQLQPPGLCPHKQCGLRHSPDLCCICSSPHPVEKCWHLIGLPEARKNVRDQYKVSIDQKKLELKPALKTTKAVSESRHIDIRTDVPTDLAPPEDRVDPAPPMDMTPSDGDLQESVDVYLDMMERESLIDTTFHHPISYSSMVDITPEANNLIDDNMVDIEYPSHAPEEEDKPLVPPTDDEILSKIPPELMKRNLGMHPSKPLPDGQYYFHVDTGCTDTIVHQSLMDSDTVIDTSGANLSAGTASDTPNSSGAVTAIGFCPLYFITTNGDVEYIGFPNSMSVSGFPRNSFSLSHLRRLGFRASHHIGEYVIIYSPCGKQFAIPIITEGEQDYIVVHKENPQPHQSALPQASDTMHNVVTSVALVNLARLLPDENQFYLWHLRLGCLGPDALEALSASGIYKGIPSNLKKPATFNCPICDQCNLRSVNHHPAQSTIIQRKGVRFGADFCFPYKESVRGYKTALTITEYTSSYSWVFLRQNRSQPVDILLWFVLNIRKCLQLPCNVLRVDMEFFNNKVLLRALAEIHCQLEPTGGYNGAGNAKVENNAGLAKKMMRCLLVGGNKPPSYWCFALVHGIFLLNLIGRRILDHKSSQSVLFGVEASKDDLTFLRVLFSRVYVKIHRTTRNRADTVGRAHPGVFMGFHGTGSVILYEDSNKKIRFTHHAVIDELHSDVEPLQRCPAAKMLHRQDIRTGRMLHDIQASVELLEITNSRWELHGVRVFHVPNLTPTGHLGCSVKHDSNVGRIQITAIKSDGPLATALQNYNVIGRYLLNVNGVDIYTVQGLTHALQGIHSCAIQSVSGITVLIGRLPDDTSVESTPHHQFAVHNFNKLTEIWAIDSVNQHSVKKRDDSIPIDYANTKPPSWKSCMKGPDRQRWIEALHIFMEKCRPYSTFSLPIVPPPGATVLNLVIVLKYALDEYQRLREFKLRLCAHGGQSVAGKDYDMSFAPAPVSASLRLMVANYAWLKGVHPTLRCLHYDIRNCFQSVPDKRERIFVKCFPEMWHWFSITYPDLMDQIKKKYPNASIDQFACIAWTYLQGQVDASLQWKLLNERVLIGELGLTPNRADPCVYSGVVDGDPLIILRATDDYLTLATPNSAKIFKRHLTHTRDGKPRWKVNDYGPAKLFFGIRIIESDDAITIDQRQYAVETLTRFLGKNWHMQVKSSTRTEGPWQYGSKFEAALVSSLKTTIEERKLLSQEFGFEFRELLGRFHQLSTWTRPDLTPGTIRMSTFQNAPGRIHFTVLKGMLLFLARFPDRGLTYPIRHLESSTTQVLDGHKTLVNTVEIHVGDRIDSPIEMSYSPVDKSVYRPLDGPMIGVSAIRVTAPPPTEAEVDASYGSIYDTSAVAGFHLFMLGTLVHWFSKKLPTPAQSTTEAELLSANEGGKVLKWERVWMLDIGCPIQMPILLGEDNDACRIISEGGRLSRQVRHLCIHTDVLQSDARRGIFKMFRCDSADNSSDHQTKFLAPDPFWKHTTRGMGERFITVLHRRVLDARNSPQKKDDA